jgi:hypothetical protein
MQFVKIDISWFYLAFESCFKVNFYTLFHIQVTFPSKNIFGNVSNYEFYCACPFKWTSFPEAIRKDIIQTWHDWKPFLSSRGGFHMVYITKSFDCSLSQFVRFLVSKIYRFILNHPQFFPYMEPLIEVPFLTLTTHKHRSKNQILILPILWSMSKGTHLPLKNVSFWIHVTQYSILSIVFVLKLHDFYDE